MNKTIILTATLLLSTSLWAQSNLKDTQIAKIAIVLNDGEVDAAKIARNKVTHPEVKSFATIILDDHKKNIKETKDLAKREKFTPEGSDLSKSLTEEIKQSNKNLKKTNKASLDRAYIDQQVMMHEKALQTFDTILIPQAQNAALKEHLQKTREAVSGHLAQVKQLQTQLK